MKFYIYYFILFFKVMYPSDQHERELKIQNMIYDLDDKLTEIVAKPQKTIEDHAQIISIVNTLTDEFGCAISYINLKQYERMKRYSETIIYHDQHIHEETERK